MKLISEDFSFFQFNVKQRQKKARNYTIEKIVTLTAHTTIKDVEETSHTFLR